MIKNMHKNGFTLIETLVAISILMIAIAGPLTVANKAYTSAQDARNQTIAYNLAQEGLEYINNIKSNNTWPDGRVWVHTEAYPVVPSVFIDCKDGCYDATVGFIDPNLPSNFGRSYKFTYGTTDFSDADQVLVTVKVIWNTGTSVNNVQLQEILTDFER